PGSSPPPTSPTSATRSTAGARWCSTTEAGTRSPLTAHEVVLALLGGDQGGHLGGRWGWWRGETVRGLEQQLLQRTGEGAAPDQGRRRGQRMMLKADADHAGGIHRPGWPDRRGPAARDGDRAGQDGGEPVRGGGEGQGQGQRAPERRGGGGE